MLCLIPMILSCAMLEIFVLPLWHLIWLSILTSMCASFLSCLMNLPYLLYLNGASAGMKAFAMKFFLWGNISLGFFWISGVIAFFNIVKTMKDSKVVVNSSIEMFLYFGIYFIISLVASYFALKFNKSVDDVNASSISK